MGNGGGGIYCRQRLASKEQVKLQNVWVASAISSLQVTTLRDFSYVVQRWTASALHKIYLNPLSKDFLRDDLVEMILCHSGENNLSN